MYYCPAYMAFIQQSASLPALNLWTNKTKIKYLLVDCEVTYAPPVASFYQTESYHSHHEWAKNMVIFGARFTNVLDKCGYLIDSSSAIFYYAAAIISGVITRALYRVLQGLSQQLCHFKSSYIIGTYFAVK